MRLELRHCSFELTNLPLGTFKLDVSERGALLSNGSSVLRGLNQSVLLFLQATSSSLGEQEKVNISYHTALRNGVGRFNKNGSFNDILSTLHTPLSFETA